MIDRQNKCEDGFAALIQTDGFSKLDPEIQKQLIRSMARSQENSGGTMGRFLGKGNGNLAINAILFLCVGLLLLVILDNLHAYCTGAAINMDLINIIVPVITMSIGYIIGKGAK